MCSSDLQVLQLPKGQRGRYDAQEILKYMEAKMGQVGLQLQRLQMLLMYQVLLQHQHQYMIILIISV